MTTDTYWLSDSRTRIINANARVLRMCGPNTGLQGSCADPPASHNYTEIPYKPDVFHNAFS